MIMVNMRGLYELFTTNCAFSLLRVEQGFELLHSQTVTRRILVNLLLFSISLHPRGMHSSNSNSILPVYTKGAWRTISIRISAPSRVATSFGATFWAIHKHALLFLFAHDLGVLGIEQHQIA